MTRAATGCIPFAGHQNPIPGWRSGKPSQGFDLQTANGNNLNKTTALSFMMFVLMLLAANPMRGQDSTTAPTEPTTPSQHPVAAQTPSDGTGPCGKIDSPDPKPEVLNESNQHNQRILWIIPNFKAVDTNTQLPPLSVKQKFWLATQDSTDYSAFIYTGMVAGIAMANKSEPSFGQGAGGYGIYYAHAYADGFIENTLSDHRLRRWH